MRILFPYNEILPKKKAHDVFIFQECASLADRGLNVTLLCGQGSGELHHHYEVPPSPNFKIKTLPIIRKNNPFNLSWNLPFFFFCQKEIQHRNPDWVFLSVPKQARYHLQRKIPGIRYLYEVHELCDREILSRADLILTTTQALKEILLQPPYSLSVPIEVVPLAVNRSPLPPIQYKQPLTLMYVGQLYPEQGLPLLLSAIGEVADVKLKIIGGTKEEIAKLSSNAPSNVEFLGFHSPSELPKITQEAHAFVAPFEKVGRMPYVAHTKLFEYAEWGRPFIAPDLPIVQEHFSDGVLFFEAGNAKSLIHAIERLKEDWERLQKEITIYSGQFNWEARISQLTGILQRF